MNWMIPSNFVVGHTLILTWILVFKETRSEFIFKRSKFSLFCIIFFEGSSWVIRSMISAYSRLSFIKGIFCIILFCGFLVLLLICGILTVFSLIFVLIFLLFVFLFVFSFQIISPISIQILKVLILIKGGMDTWLLVIFFLTTLGYWLLDWGGLGSYIFWLIKNHLNVSSVIEDVLFN